MTSMPITENGNLDALLLEATRLGASASLRESGSLRMLGDLQLQSMEPGKSLIFKGAKRRDQHPPIGTVLTLTLLLGEEAFALRTSMLELIPSPEEAGPLVRVAWPTQVLESHRREDLRVATPGLPSLDAQVDVGGRQYSGKVLNLSETGIGLGFPQSFPLVLKAHLGIETVLPGDILVKITGDIRNMEILEDDPLPLRVGVVLAHLEGPTPERMRRFIQARRTELSMALRKSIER